MPLPKLPKIPMPPSPVQPLRDMVQGGREQIEKARDNIRSIADDIKGGTTPAPPRETEGPVSIEHGAEKGTACITCSDEHFSEVSGALNEAMRFARTSGMGDYEVLKRIRHAREELNAMERFDLSSQQIVRLPEIEKPAARWAVEQSRELRHGLGAINSTDDLEKVAAKASEVADEFEKKTMELKKYYQGETRPDITELRRWLEERKK